MSSQTNPGQQYANSNQQHSNPSHRSNPSAEYQIFFHSRQDIYNDQDAALSDLVVAGAIAPFRQLCEPPYNVPRTILPSVLKSWISYMSAGQVSWPRAISGQADQCYRNELERWRSLCPSAPQLFRDINSIYGEGRSLEDRIGTAGAYMHKKAKFEGSELDYRDYHHAGLGLDDEATLRQQYVQVIQCVNAARGLQQPRQRSEQTQPTFAPHSITHQSTMSQSTSNGPSLDFDFDFNTPPSLDTPAPGYNVPVDLIMSGTSYGDDSQQTQDWFQTGFFDAQEPQVQGGNSFPGSSSQTEEPWTYPPDDWSGQYPPQ